MLSSLQSSSKSASTALKAEMDLIFIEYTSFSVAKEAGRAEVGPRLELKGPGPMLGSQLIRERAGTA